MIILATAAVRLPYVRCNKGLTLSRQWVFQNDTGWEEGTLKLQEVASQLLGGVWKLCVGNQKWRGNRLQRNEASLQVLLFCKLQSESSKMSQTYLGTRQDI